jgi:integrase
MARPIGTTRVKKPIEKYEFEKLILFISKTKFIKQQRLRVKLKRAFTLLYLTGCRISEIIDLTTNDINKIVEYKEYSLSNNTKTKTSRLIVFSTAQIDLLKTIIPRVNIKLFDVTTEYFTIKANLLIHKCLGLLYSTHSFRVGYVTRLANNGENIELIRSDIGHKNIATTARYIKVTSEDKRKAKERLSW